MIEMLDGNEKDKNKSNNNKRNRKKLNKINKNISEKTYTYKDIENMFNEMTNCNKIENTNIKNEVKFIDNNSDNVYNEGGIDLYVSPIDELFDSIDDFTLNFEDYMICNCENITKFEAWHIFQVVFCHYSLLGHMLNFYLSSNLNTENLEPDNIVDFIIFIPKDIRKTNSISLYLYKNNGKRNSNDAFIFHLAFDNIFSPYHEMSINPFTVCRMDYKNFSVVDGMRNIKQAIDAKIKESIEDQLNDLNDGDTLFLR